MFIKGKLLRAIFALLVFIEVSASAQSILPPVIEWKGKSELLIAESNNPWITPSEKSGFITTPDYNETMNWFKRLSEASTCMESLFLVHSKVKFRTPMRLALPIGL